MQEAVREFECDFQLIRDPQRDQAHEDIKVIYLLNTNI